MTRVKIQSKCKTFVLFFFQEKDGHRRDPLHVICVMDVISFLTVGRCTDARASHAAQAHANLLLDYICFMYNIYMLGLFPFRSDRVFSAVGRRQAIVVVGQQSFERNVISIRHGCRVLRLHSKGKVVD